MTPQKKEALREKEMERMTEIMNKRGERWQQAPWGRVAIRILGDSLLVVKWLRGTWTVTQKNYARCIADLHNLMDNARCIDPSAPGEDLVGHL